MEHDAEESGYSLSSEENGSDGLVFLTPEEEKVEQQLTSFELMPRLEFANSPYFF